MTKKKYTPPTWDEKGKRWRKVAYCNGMSKTFCSTKKGKTSAEKEIMAAIEEWKCKMQGLQSLRNLTPMSPTADVYKEYLEDLKARVSVGCWTSVEVRMRIWAIPEIGRIPISEINDGIRQRVINIAYQKGHLAHKTLQCLASDISSLVKFARRNQLTHFVPERIDIPRGAAKSEKVILQPSDLKTLFTIDTTVYNGALAIEQFINAFRLQVILCLRPGEVGGLKASDLHGNILHIQRSLNQLGEITKGKNDNAVRNVALSDLGMKIWQKQLSILGEDPDWMFPGWRGIVYRKHLAKYCEVNHITVVTPYELRHTSFSIAQTLPEGLVKKLGGHSQNMDTFGIYGHALEGDKELTAELMQDRIQNLIG